MKTKNQNKNKNQPKKNKKNKEKKNRLDQDNKISYVNVIDTNQSLIKKFMNVKYMMDTNYFNYLKILFGIDSVFEKYAIPDIRSDNSVKTKHTHKEVCDIEIGANGVADVFLNLDYLLTEQFAKIFSDKEVSQGRYSIGLISTMEKNDEELSQKINDIMIDAIDVKDALRYRLLAAEITSDNKDTNYELATVHMDIIPKVLLLDSDKEQLHMIKYESTDIRNLGVIETAKKAVTQFTHLKDKIKVTYVPNSNTVDYIGMLDNKVPILIGGFNAENLPKLIKTFNDNVGNSHENVRATLEKEYQQPFSLLVHAYRFYNAAVKFAEKRSVRTPFYYIKIIGAPNTTVKLNLLLKYEIYSDESLGSVVETGGKNKKDKKVCNAIRYIRKIFYYLDVKQMIEMLGDKNGLVLSGQNVNIINKIQTMLQNQDIYESVMATLVRMTLAQ